MFHWKSEGVAAVRRRCRRRARKVEDLLHDLWRDEALLGGLEAKDPESEELQADIGCLCVDYLHPAQRALQKAAEPYRRPEPESEDIETRLPKVPA